MSYKYDIFISYRRDDETRGWIKKHLVPLVKLHVGQELTRHVTVFYDENLETGTSWPPQLGARLAESRILIALWSKDNFYSAWCSKEMEAMLAHEKYAKLRTVSNPRGLIVPFVIHDGEDFPGSLSHIQRLEI